jgi:hypothetical protein
MKKLIMYVLTYIFVLATLPMIYHFYVGMYRDYQDCLSIQASNPDIFKGCSIFGDLE